MSRKPTYQELLDKISLLEQIISRKNDTRQADPDGSSNAESGTLTGKDRWITRQRFEKAEKVAGLGHWEIDMDTRTMFGSKGAAKIYGVEENTLNLEEVQKFPLPEYRPVLDKALNDLVKRGIPYNLEFKIRRKTDGKVRDIQSIAEYDRERGVVFGIIQDITSKKDAERDLRASENRYKTLNERLEKTLDELRNANRILEEEKKKAQESDQLKSAFLANMSHEIRTPMNSIIGFSDLLAEENLTADKRRKYAEMISHSGEQLMRLINDIIDISKIESNQLHIEKEWCSPEYLLQDILTRYEETSKDKPDLKLIIHKSDDDRKLKLYTDCFRLRQIIDNLINNAIKFTDKGYVEAGYRLPENRKGMLEFYVKDTGIGIPAESLDKIFIRFIQADNVSQKRGTGLGLSISKGLAELLGGEITVESEPGKGSLFRFTHPLGTGEPDK